MVLTDAGGLHTVARSYGTKVSVLLLVSILGLATDARANELAAGADLAAWHQLDLATADESEVAAQYRAFLEAYPESPLAEVAWDRLRRMGVAVAPGVGSAGRRSRELQRSWSAHQEVLFRRSSRVAVAPLNADGFSSENPPSPWSLHLHANGGWQGQDLSGAVGGEVRYGLVGVVARLGHAQSWYGQAGLRVTGNGWGPWGETTMTFGPKQSPGAYRPLLDVIGGGRVPLVSGLWFEAGAGIHVDTTVGPAARLGLVYGR